jgi:glycosyltransferase involved in cell wall biosynthesis
MNDHYPTILFERGVPWETIYPVSTRVLAEYFARRDWNVIWMTSPLAPWHFLGQSKDRRQAITQYRQNGIFYQGNRVFAYTPSTPIPFSRRFPFDRPFLARLRWRACVPSVQRVLDQRGVPKPDILWLGSFHAGGLRQLFPDAASIFHVTDAFRHYTTAPATCVDMERENYHVADRIVVTAPALKRLLLQDFEIPAERISVIMHGVELDRFSQLTDEEDPLADYPRPRLVALGNTVKLHFGVLARLAAWMEEGSVVVIGPKTKRLNEMTQELPALKLVGALPPDDVPRYLHYCDLGLVLFGEHMTRVADYVCPMKLFEYAAAGLPVVSTPLPVYDALDAPVLQTSTPQEAVEAVIEALENREYLGSAMREFAEENTWQRRYQEAEQVVTELMGDR